MVVTLTPNWHLPSAISREVARPRDERPVTLFLMVNVASETSASAGTEPLESILKSQSVVVYLPSKQEAATLPGMELRPTSPSMPWKEADIARCSLPVAEN